jgi:hypothetical protein
MLHTCHAHGCTVRISPRLFACRGHWFALRPELQRAIWREYRFGQEVDKKPSLRYLCVQQRAVAELAFKPHDEAAALACAPYALKSNEYRLKAIDDGLGDPLEGLAEPPVRSAA